jgi:hypothetical protein
VWVWLPVSAERSFNITGNFVKLELHC